MKGHQREGLEWLQRNWRFGSPGVLLADDMGLGKTLQGLVIPCLAARRHGVGGCPGCSGADRGTDRSTGELASRACPASIGAGPGTAPARVRQGARRTPAIGGSVNGLDVAALRQADWVLTTYEALRDHDRDFGAVRFAVMLLDEAQKVKTPGIRLTDAAKAMNADFRIAMTGTPVENRLSDLWCIVDGVAPGHLGELRRFSAQYEASEEPDRLTGLKASLDTSLGGRPPLMLRRMKEDKLPDLPPRTEVIRRAEMSGAQVGSL